VSAGKSAADQEATRYLAAATQVSIDYANMVVKRVMHEPFRALAPTFGVDVPVVVKWALQAQRTRTLRDKMLAMTCVLALLSGVPLMWPQGLILLPIALITAWLIVTWENWQRYHNVLTKRMLRDRFDPAQAPAPPTQAERERLAEVAERRDGNLVVFSGHSAFIGSGWRLDYQRILLDVSRGTEEDNGARLQPLPFTTQDLHDAIVRAFSQQHGLAGTLANIKVHERLFVNGLHVQNDARLLPDPLQPPPSSVDRDLLAAATAHPTPEARTYICVEMPGWHGQLVVTMFIRAVRAGDSLYIEWSFRVLPPLSSGYFAIDRLHELHACRQFVRSMRAEFRKTAPALIRSPFVSLRAYRAAHVAQRKRSRQANAIRNGYVFDYGALRSIREIACGMQRRHYFLARDETMYVLLAQQTLTRAIEVFLEEHNVSLGEFETQVKVIFDNSISVGDIGDSTGIVIGNNSSAAVNGQEQGNK
jgi:hypothetical protein